jgi:rRNA maturation endonuclease Nob1
VCSVGGPFGDEEIVWPKNYRCSACGKKFKAVGEDPACPSCQSSDLEELPDD